MDVISCVSLGWCLNLFSSLPTLYEKVLQVDWGASDERPGVCVVFCFLRIWLYGRGEGGAHTLCKWMSLFGCVFLVPCIFVCLTMLYREATQLV